MKLDLFRYYVGCHPYIIITDLDILKQVLIKDFDCFTNRVVCIFVCVVCVFVCVFVCVCGVCGVRMCIHT